jgi:DNA-binding CsgD family transcriptional regulator
MPPGGCALMHVSLDTLDRAVQFVDSLADLDQPDRAADFILPGLAGLIGCDIATYQEMSPEPNRLGHYTEYPAASLDPAAVPVFEAHMDEHPLVKHKLAAGGSGPARISDVVSRQRFRQLGIYCEYFRHIPTDDQIAFTLPGTRDSQLVGVALSRSNREFSAADSALLSSVMPPMRNALRRSGRRRDARAAVAAEPDALGELTDRELEVLQMAARGRTNLAIARAADVSPRTIAKHLEHIYRKLGVTSRAAAVYRAVGPGRPGQAALTARRPELIDASGTPPAVPCPGRLVPEQPRPGARRLRGQLAHGRPGRLGDRLGVHHFLRLRRALQAVPLDDQGPAVLAQAGPGFGLLEQLAQDAGQPDRARPAPLGAEPVPPLPDELRCGV